MVPKDDNFGLGVRDGVDFNNGKCTGLDVFHGILGRLNGKDGEQIQRQENPIEDQKKATKQESRFGALLFVSGGFLGESGQEELLAKCIKQSISKDEPAQAINRSVKQSSRTTKENPATPTELIEPSENRISRKNRVRSKLAAVDELRSKNSESYTLVSFEQDDVRQTTSTTSDLATEPLTAAQRLMKAERKQRKSMKREARRAISTDLPKAPETLPATNIQETSSLPPKAAPTGDLTVPQSRRPMGGRHAVRQRYISHKRMAMMDSKALNEVGRVPLMICKVEICGLTDGLCYL